MKKRTAILPIILAIVLMVGVVFTGCIAEEPEEKEEEIHADLQVTILNPTGPTVIPVAGIQSDNIVGEIDVNVQYWNNMDEITAALAKDEAQFVIMPVTTGANLYNQGMDIQLVGVHTWKLFYMVSNDVDEFDSWEALAGKEIYTPVGKGQTVDVIMRTAFHNAGLDPETDVSIVYAPPQEIVALFKEGKIEYAALPEPFVTLATQGDSGSVILDFQEYWGELTGLKNRFPITGVFVAKDFYEENPQAAEEVIKLISESVSWANTNTSEAVAASSEVLPLPEPAVLLALERIDFTFVPASECQEEVNSFFEKTKEFYPEASDVPDAGFYR